MARLWQSGFELNSLSNGVEITNTNVSGGGAVAISSSIKRTGTYSFRASNSGASGLARLGLVFGSAQAGPIRARTYFYVADTPGSLNPIMALWDASTLRATIRLATDNTLELWDSAGKIGSSSSALTGNTWYCIELKYRSNGSSTELEGRLAPDDGTTPSTFASTTSSTNSGNIDRLSLGSVSNNTSYDYYFDDVAINDGNGSDQTGFPGPGAIVHLYPNAAGDNADWGLGAGSGANYLQVDESGTPDDTSTYVRSRTTNQIDDYNIDNWPGGSSDVINVVAVGYRATRSNGTTSSSMVPRIKASSGGTVSEGTSKVASNSAFRTNDLDTSNAAPFMLVTYAKPGGGAWSVSDLNSSQIGARVDSGSGDRYVHLGTIWASVDFTPGTSHFDLVVADMAIGLTEDAVALTQKHTLTVSDIAIGLSAESPTLVQDTALIVADTAIGLTFDAPTLTQKHILVVSDLQVGLTVDNVSITQKHTLVVADMSLGITTDSPTLTSAQTLVVNDISLGMSIDGTTLTQKHTLAVADMNLSTSIDAISVTQKHTLSVADMTIGVSYEHVALSTAATLGVNDLRFGVTAESPTPTQKHTLAVNDITIAVTFDTPNLSQKHTLVVSDIAIGVSTDSVTLSRAATLTVTDVTIGVSVEVPLLSQKHNLTITDVTIGTSFDTPTISQDYQLAAADLAIGLSIDSPSPTTETMLLVSDMLISLQEDSLAITQKQDLSVADMMIATAFDSVTISTGQVVLAPNHMLFSTRFDKTSNPIITERYHRWYRKNNTTWEVPEEV